MNASQEFDICVVGGGIVGAATAYKLSRRYPEAAIALVEKESRLAHHQTGNNSGVIHSGIYYKPGSYKARNCVNGRKELVRFCKEHGVAHEVCGKLIVAVDESELPGLQKIFERGVQNGIEGIEMVGPDFIREREPFCAGIRAVFVPVTGICDFRAATEKMAELFQAAQPRNQVLLNWKVEHIQSVDGLTRLSGPAGEIRARFVVYCAGLQSDRLARREGLRPDSHILGFRGDYYDLAPHAVHKVKHLIYPVPNPKFPFLGVHFTRMVHGGVECGPNAVFTFKREGYRKTDFSLTDTAEAFSHLSTWKFFAKHWKFGLDEYLRAFSKKRFLRTLQRLIPSLTEDEIVPARAGVRAMALGADGEMIDDFKIEYGARSLHVLNAPSPAATAALAIGDEIVNMAEKHFNLSA
ncbi:MAG: L-2-hydroxyglutarate oxidase [Flavobacteriales bacterium]|nr:L-2-hydroxyglutarate oxidase [Flavobacteriales bacterium]